MTLKDRFLREARPGAYVEIVVGLKEIKGVIISLNSSIVRINKDDGNVSTITIEDISYYELSEKKTGGKEYPVDRPAVFDLNAVEERGLVFETNYWQSDIDSLSITPAIKGKMGKADPSNALANNLNSLLSKLANCVKVNEFDPKFGRIQPISSKIKSLCESYKEDFLYELMAIVLIEAGTTYRELFNNSCFHPLIRLGDAVVCYRRKNYEEMAYYCSEYYAKEKLTEKNFDNLIYLMSYLLRYGHEEVLREKEKEVKEMSESRQAVFESAYNNARVTSAIEGARYYPVDAPSGQLKTSPAASRVMVDDIRILVNEYIRNGDFKKAIDTVNQKIKENPDNADLSELLKYVLRVKKNVAEYKNIPLGGIYFVKAWKDWHLYEDYSSAEKNFVLSINKKENGTYKPIMSYIDLIFEQKGVRAAIEKLKSYKYSFRDLHLEYKYYEKLEALYREAEDNENRLACLRELKNAYRTKTKKRAGGDRKTRNNNKKKIAEIAFKISECLYMQGDYQNAIYNAREALRSGYDMYTCINQIVSCYNAMNEFDAARDAVREYVARNDDLAKLFKKIDSVEEAYKSNDKSGNTGSDIHKRSDYDNEFISRYEAGCEYEGISEGKRISRHFTQKDIKAIDSQISFTKRGMLKDRADYYLTAACLEKSLNGSGDKYYGYMANSMLNQGHLLLANESFDRAMSFYLTAISMSQISVMDDRIEEESICGYLYALLRLTDTLPETINIGNEVKSLLPIISGQIEKNKLVQSSFLRILHVSHRLKSFFMDNATTNLCLNTIKDFMEKVSCDRINDLLWDKIEEMHKEADRNFAKWYSAVQLDKTFLHDNENAASDVSGSIIVTGTDIDTINKFLRCCSEIKEYAEYTDFDNRIRVLNQGKNDLNDLIEDGHDNSTLFFENYLIRILRVSIDNLEAIISRTFEDYKPELSIEIPVTSIPPKDGKISLSVTISNADNKATARSISLTVLGVDSKVLCTRKIKSINLKGGASISELVNISTENREVFTLTIVLNYKDDENIEYTKEKKVSISTKANDFEIINNPYITGSPVEDDKMFFGREALIQRLTNAICDDRIRCIVIYGQKRTGKSSIFKHLKKKLTDQFIMLDFSIGADVTNELNFYKTVQAELVEFLEDNDFDENMIDLLDNYQINDFIDFERFLRKVKRTVVKLLNKELLLMIDEFTYIYKYIMDPEYEMSSNFMDKWKAMIEKNLFKSALIGQDYMPEFIQKYANQFQVTNPVYVTYLDREAAIDLVVKPVSMENGRSRFLEGSEEMIFDWFKGQPYFLQTYCSRLVNYLNEEQKQNYVTTAIAITVKNRMLKQERIEFFDSLINIQISDQQEPDELKKRMTVLRKIAQVSEDADAKIKVSRLHLNDEQKEILDKFVLRGVVDYYKLEEKCRITIPFFHEWLRISN